MFDLKYDALQKGQALNISPILSTNKVHNQKHGIWYFFKGLV